MNLIYTKESAPNEQQQSPQLMSGYKPRIRARPKVNSRAALSVEANQHVHGPKSVNSEKKTIWYGLFVTRFIDFPG